jgi:hypothetical protein
MLNAMCVGRQLTGMAGLGKPEKPALAMVEWNSAGWICT